MAAVGYYPAPGAPAAYPPPPLAPYAAPGAVIVTAMPGGAGGAGPGSRHWAMGAFQMLGGSDPWGTCCYVIWCGSCAAGEIADAAGRSYCMSCFICPVFAPCCLPGHYAQDRDAFAKRFGIADEIGCCGACLMFYCGCGYCLLCQEYATLKAFTYAAMPAGATVIVSQPTVASMYQAPPVTGGVVYSSM